MKTVSGRFALKKGRFELRAEFEAPGEGITCIFGGSGAGKTTLLRCMAGLEKAEGSSLSVNGAQWQGDKIFLPAHRRPLGYVFQIPSLFRHLSVRGNLEFGWKRAGAQSRKIGFDHVADLLELSPLLERKPATLSGGEGQRVTIARALLSQPELLLMDEPLSGLDLKTRDALLNYLDKLRAEFRMPIFYVSHSLDEVARLADHLLLMKDGRIEAAGSPHEVLCRLDLPLAVAEDAEAIVEARLMEQDWAYHLSVLQFEGGRLLVPMLDVPVGHRVRVRIRARDVSLALRHPEATSILNTFPTQVLEMSQGDRTSVTIKLSAGSTILLARITRKSQGELGIRPGITAHAQVKAVSVIA